MKLSINDLDLQFLGKVPEHWKVLRIKQITQEHKQGYYTEQAYVDKGIKLARITDIDDSANVSFKNMPFVAISPKDEQVFSVQYGDFLFARSGTIGRFGLVRNPERSVFASYLIRFRFKDVNPEFLRFVFSSHFFKEGLISTLHGGVNKNVHAENIKEQFIAIPSSGEQKAIARYLDHKTVAIDTLITKKQCLIQLLEEKRDALINQAVTKGLNPNVPMKDSGISWIGEIPMHWKVLRLKFITEVRSGVAKGRDLKDKNIIELPYLRVANVQDGYLDLSDISNIAIEVSEERRFLLCKGDILMNEGGDDDKLGRGAVWEGQIEPCIHQNHVFAVRPFKDINSYWINLTTQASYLKHFFLTKAKRTTNLASISSSSLKESPIIFPPIKEQEEILAKVQKDLEQIQKIYRTIIIQIEKLQEYRQSLITAAVTGKIDITQKEAA